MYATGVGLVLHAIKSRQRGASGNVGEEKVSGRRDSIVNRMRKWFDEL